MRSSRATAVAGASPDALRRLAELSRRRRTAIAAGIALVVLVTAPLGATGRDTSGGTHAPRFSEYPAGAAYRGTPAALATYEAGSWGPPEADAFIARDGGGWRQP